MPSSQEEYLDALLKGVTEPEAKEVMPEEPEAEEVMPEEPEAEEVMPEEPEAEEVMPEEPEAEEVMPEEPEAEEVMPEEPEAEEAMPEEPEAEEVMPEAVAPEEVFSEQEALPDTEDMGIFPVGMEFQDIISEDITLGDLMPEILPVEEMVSEEPEIPMELDDLDTLLKMAEEASDPEFPAMDIPDVELPELDIPDINQPMDFSYTKLTEYEPPVDEIFQEETVIPDDLNGEPEDTVFPEFELPEAEFPEMEVSETEFPADTADMETDISGTDMAADMETDISGTDMAADMETDISGTDMIAGMETDVSGTDMVADMETAEEEDDSNVQLTQEEIEQLLAESRAEFVSAPAEEAPSDETDDLMSLLQGTEDAELQEIHDMLQKADNNEAVDEGVAALMESFSESGDLEGNPLTDGYDEEEEQLSARERRALEKKRQKEEKAAAKKAAKDAKKAAKEAKKSGAKQTDDTLTDAGHEKGNAQAEAPAGPERIPLPPDAVEEADMAELDELLGLIGEGEKAEEPEENDVIEVEIDDADMIRAIGEKPKKGLFARILDYFTEEDAEEEPKKGTEDVPISDENKAILDEIDKESAKGKKGKKPKKGKNAKGAEDADDFDEDGAPGKGRKAKEKKPKKEKVPKEKTPGETGPRLSPRKVIPILACGLSVMLAIIVIVNLGGDYTVKKEARQAFYQEDYETCYQNLYGKELSETEQVMLGKSESILRIRLWMREYEFFAEEGKEPQALDILIQSVNDYAPLYEYAKQWNAETEVGKVYEQMLDILADKYHLTEIQVLKIASEPDDVEYTKKVIEAAGGTVPGTAAQTPAYSVESVIEQLPDMLPEEMEFPENRMETEYDSNH